MQQLPTVKLDKLDLFILIKTQFLQIYFYNINAGFHCYAIKNNNQN